MCAGMRAGGPDEAEAAMSVHPSQYTHTHVKHTHTEQGEGMFTIKARGR